MINILIISFIPRPGSYTARTSKIQLFLKFKDGSLREYVFFPNSTISTFDAFSKIFHK